MKISKLQNRCLKFLHQEESNLVILELGESLLPPSEVKKSFEPFIRETRVLGPSSTENLSEI